MPATQGDLDVLMEQAIRMLVVNSTGIGVDTSDIQGILWSAREQRIKRGINLIPSENRKSPKAKLMSWLGELAGLDGRYAEGHVGKRYYPGTQASDALETIAIAEAKDLMGAKWVDIRPISGNNVNMAVFLNYLQGGDFVMANTIYKGGHISHADVGSLGKRVTVRGRELKEHLIPIPVTEDGYHMDGVATAKLIERYKPKLIVLGKSLFLFPEDIGAITEICQQTGTRIYYDGAHVLGLIVGGQFQQPLKEGAEVVGGSTHKTLAGPQGGIIYSNLPPDDPLIVAIDKGIMPGTTSSHHLHRIPALIVTLREYKQHGPEYASQTIRNAQALAEALDKYGLTPDAKEFGYTRSHQVALNVRRLTGTYSKEVETWLDRNGIFANSNALPYDTSVFKTSGIRMGTPEVTIQGMREGEMDRIAWMFRRVIIDRANVSLESRDLARNFPDRMYA
ncbi:serine hydroxymethyltransferase [Candidatus Woesearchaeota archaeon]|nr:serine hydroxymethyltransferase [Candidatus Woesearchaeota archaeon]